MLPDGSPDYLPNVHVSRFGVIPKKSPGKWRLIVDLSAPDNYSVNDGVYERFCSMQYVSVENAIQLVVKQGPGALMAKIDIKSAYRNVPIHSDDRWLLGMMWKGSVFVDAMLTFGLQSAPKIFTAIADGAEWVARTRGVNNILHYLDDFFLTGAPSSDECRVAKRTLLQDLGVPVNLPDIFGLGNRLNHHATTAPGGKTGSTPGPRPVLVTSSVLYTTGIRVTGRIVAFCLFGCSLGKNLGI